MLKKNAPLNQQRGGRGWLLALALGLLACMVMGLVLVWSNIERMDTTYFINIAQNELRERRALRAKLEVEMAPLIPRLKACFPPMNCAAGPRNSACASPGRGR